MPLVVKWIRIRPSIDVEFVPANDDYPHDIKFSKFTEAMVESGEIVSETGFRSDDNLTNTKIIEFSSLDAFWKYEKAICQYTINENDPFEYKHCLENKIIKIKEYNLT